MARALALAGSEARVPEMKGSIAVSRISRPSRRVMKSDTLSCSCPPRGIRISEVMRILACQLQSGDRAMPENVIGTWASLSRCST